MGDWRLAKCEAILEAALAFKAAKQNLLDVISDRDTPEPEAISNPEREHLWIQTPVLRPGPLTLKAKAAKMKLGTFIKGVISGRIPADAQTVKQARLATVLRRITKRPQLRELKSNNEWEE